MDDLKSGEKPTWCPGCGNFNILEAVKTAIIELNLPAEDVLLVSGIGCGSKLPRYVKAYGFEGLHGRALPVATGAKLANQNLHVMVTAGDGDGYGIGGNHYLHIMRRNFDITYIVQNNAVYGLTKGQTSPTSQKGFKSPSTPSGVIEEPVNPVLWGIIGGATYVARGYAFEFKHLSRLIADGIKHKGFSLIDVLQPCHSYNKVNTVEWYKGHLYKLDNVRHDPADREQAMKRAGEMHPKMPIGLFYKANKPAYEDELPQIAEKPLAKQDITNIDLTDMMKRFK
jgi:2-oxoglutarate ferredoxin oxidoreductase subunit beta